MAFETISLAAGETVVEVVPERGAIVSRLSVRGREVLYLDRATLDDASKNVRGGVPVLFPFAGRLPEDRFAPAGTTMKQHGFGRNLPWAVADAPAPAPAAARDEVTLELAASDVTRAQFPYEFRFHYRICAKPRGVLLELAAHNLGDVPMPMAPGWHPYFTCAAAAKAAVRSDIDGFPHASLTDEREFDFGVPRPAGVAPRIQIPDLGEVSLALSPALGHLQFWSLPGKPFLCFEPFCGPPGVINTPGRDEVLPGGITSYSVWIELLPIILPV